VPAVRRYLRQFLSDPRVIEAPRWLWWLILNFRILWTRPAASAAKYQRIWSQKTGMPLLYYTKRQVEELAKALPGGLPVRYAMRYGNPSTSTVVQEMIDAGIGRFVVLPMYPQYSATTTASALDGLFQALMKERRVPALRVVPPYYAHPAYLDAIAAIVKEDLERLPWQPEHFVLSFHGIPIKYVERGDPYARQVEETARLLIPRLGWPEGKWSLCYQSILGKEPWLSPYTDVRLQELAHQGVRQVYVATPGFTADCLETIDEVGKEFREAFEAAGGKELGRCPCLNDHPLWIEGMKRLILEELGSSGRG
jgi:ferrochelatase